MDHANHLMDKNWISRIKENRKWWLLPILVLLRALGLLTFLAGTRAAPFIYTLF